MIRTKQDTTSSTYHGWAKACLQVYRRLGSICNKHWMKSFAGMKHNKITKLETSFTHTKATSTKQRPPYKPQPYHSLDIASLGDWNFKSFKSRYRKPQTLNNWQQSAASCSLLQRWCFIWVVFYLNFKWKLCNHHKIQKHSPIERKRMVCPYTNRTP